MNAAPPLVVPILATPFGVVPLPEAGALNPELTALFTARMATDSSPQADPLCYRSRDDLFERPGSQCARWPPRLFGACTPWSRP
jgi:hypothetical protein